MKHFGDYNGVDIYIRGSQYFVYGTGHRTLDECYDVINEFTSWEEKDYD